MTLEFFSSTKSQLELWPRSDTARGFGFPRALTLSVQTSSGGWQPIASASNLALPSSGPYTLSFPPTTGSIFKIDFTSLYHNYGNGIDSYMATLNEVRLH
ncbi:hypothetical protein [Lentzea sp. E54]|uniref:hypothetical protein n=1 Tax=Lentzea xerophila TaxID=3435883 RepID=UPI003DA67E19